MTEMRQHLTNNDMPKFFITIFLCIIAAKVLGHNSTVFLKNTKTLENQIVCKNTLYEIVEDVTLGRDFRLPDGVCLKFNGGSIKGKHVLEGNHTYIDASAIRIFGDDLMIKGTWIIKDAYSEWFGGGVNTNDNSLPIQKCLDGFNQLTLLSGTYNVSHTLSVNYDGCIIQGVSRAKSEIRKTPNGVQQINAIIHLNSTKNKNIQHVAICDLTLSAAKFNVDYGIYTDGVNSSIFRNLNIFQCKNGFYCNNTTHGALWNLTFNNIEFNCNTLRGFNISNPYGYKDGESCAVTCVTDGGASVTFNKCWARDCSTGYHLKGLTYSLMQNCSADNINGTAYLIEYCRMHLNCCGMENLVTSAAMILYQSDIVLTSFVDYKMIAKDKGEIYRVKIDGGRATLTNCYFTEWINDNNNPNTFAVTSNNASHVLMINTEQLKKINKFMPLSNGATLKIIEMD